jgi:hypothetical protein
LQAIREFVQALLKDKRCLYNEDNILYCEKLFIVNRVMSHVRDELSADKLSLDEMRKYLMDINRYLDGDLDLNWWDDKLVTLNKSTEEVEDA